MRYVIDASVVLRLLSRDLAVSGEHRLIAPTLIRSEVLRELYRAAREGELAEEVALERLARFATMRIRFLGDKVLRRQAWRVAQELGWDSTDAAEYIALTQLQADAFITVDPELAAEVAGSVPTASIDVLLDG